MNWCWTYPIFMLVVPYHEVLVQTNKSYASRLMETTDKWWNKVLYLSLEKLFRWHYRIKCFWSQNGVMFYLIIMDKTLKPSRLILWKIWIRDSFPQVFFFGSPYFLGLSLTKKHMWLRKKNMWVAIELMC